MALLLGACGENRTFPEHAGWSDGGGPVLTCLPDLDGQIDSDEAAPTLGVPTSFLVSPAGVERAVDVAGAADGAGRIVWDWSTDLADDLAVRVGAAALDGRWYAGDFPGGAFVTPFDPGGRIEAVWSHDDEALWLHGLASAEPAPADGATLLPYVAPLALYRFPIRPGEGWTSRGDVRGGTLHGLPYAGRDVYEVRVDAVGRLELPHLTLTQVHRVLVRATVEPAVGRTASQRQASFLFECLGEVAQATSRLDEPDEDFTVAAQVRRLGL